MIEQSWNVIQYSFNNPMIIMDLIINSAAIAIAMYTAIKLIRQILTPIFSIRNILYIAAALCISILMITSTYIDIHGSTSISSYIYNISLCISAWILTICELDKVTVSISRRARQLLLIITNASFLTIICIYMLSTTLDPRYTIVEHPLPKWLIVLEKVQSHYSMPNMMSRIGLMVYFGVCSSVLDIYNSVAILDNKIRSCNQLLRLLVYIYAAICGINFMHENLPIINRELSITLCVMSYILHMALKCGILFALIHEFSDIRHGMHRYINYKKYVISSIDELIIRYKGLDLLETDIQLVKSQLAYHSNQLTLLNSKCTMSDILRMKKYANIDYLQNIWKEMN